MSSCALEAHIVPFFGARILTFDIAVADAYASIRANVRSADRAIGATDSYIAATAAAHGFVVATRDVSPTEAAGVAVINPWLG